MLEILTQKSLHIQERHTTVWKLSKDLEINFIAEMLKAIEEENQSSEFSGGSGEEQFVSFLRYARAEKISEAGGLGLAELIFAEVAEVNHEDV